MPAAPPDSPPPRPRPFEGLGLSDWLVYRSTWLAIAPVLKGPIRLKGFGHRRIPKRGPLLLLPNHVTMLDPFMAGWLPVRPSRFMASAQPLKTPVLGTWLRKLGAFPKQKFVKDRASMQAVQRHLDDGHLVTIFPEGTRVWNGRPRHVGDGIGRLVKRTGAPVVISRMYTAYYFWPRWAHYPRFVPVHIEYEGPLTWSDDATASEITEDIRRRMACEQRLPEGAVTFGFRMAHGLPAYLWACPSCFSMRSLDVHRRDGNRVVCTGCRAQWRVQVDTTLDPQRDHDGFTVAEAHDRLVEHFGERPVADPERFARDGLALETPTSAVSRARPDRHGFDPLAEGALRLTSESLEIPAAGWRLPLDEIVAVSVEMGNLVTLRTADTLLRLDPGDGAVLLWGHFVHEWRCSVQGLPRTPVG